MAKRINRDAWGEHIRQWRNSGRAADDFAAELGVTTPTLRWWAWKLGESKRSRGGSKARGCSGRGRGDAKGKVTKGRKKLSKVSFVPLAAEPSATGTDTSALEIVLDSGHRVRVSSNLDPKILEHTLGLLLKERA